jgi:hypothetical protein
MPLRITESGICGVLEKDTLAIEEVDFLFQMPGLLEVFSVEISYDGHS